MTIIDISTTLGPRIPVWPDDPPVVLERYQSMASGGACNASRLSCSVHSGTHVDAPAHFIDSGVTVERLALDTLIGPAVVIDCGEANVVTPRLLDKLILPEGTTRLLFKTSNSMLWQNPNPVFDSDFVALSSEAAQWIVDHHIDLIGVDYLSVQRFSDPEPLTHEILLKAGVILVEGLCLQDVNAGRYELICLPLKIEGSDGAPARAALIAP